MSSSRTPPASSSFHVFIRVYWRHPDLPYGRALLRRHQLRRPPTPPVRPGHALRCHPRERRRQILVSMFSFVCIGDTLTFHMDEPFYVGISYAAHRPHRSDPAMLSDVILENAAGKF